jgi:hypothetical protein
MKGKGRHEKLVHLHEILEGRSWLKINADFSSFMFQTKGNEDEKIKQKAYMKRENVKKKTKKREHYVGTNNK